MRAKELPEIREFLPSRLSPLEVGGVVRGQVAGVLLGRERLMSWSSPSYSPESFTLVRRLRCRRSGRFRMWLA